MTDNIQDEVCATIPPDKHPHDAYAVRITPIEDIEMSIESISEWCNTLSDYWLAGYETDPHPHFHIVIWDTTHETILHSAYEKYKPPLRKTNTGKLVKWGQGFVSAGQVKEMNQAIPYAVKDGEKFSSSACVSLMELAYEQSFEKPKGVTKDLIKLKNQFVDGELTLTEVWDKYRDIYLFYDRTVVYRKAIEFVFTCTIAKDKQIWSTLFDKNKILP